MKFRQPAALLAIGRPNTNAPAFSDMLSDETGAFVKKEETEEKVWYPVTVCGSFRHLSPVPGK